MLRSTETPKFVQPRGGSRNLVWGTKYGERGAQAYTGVWPGLCPQWDPGAKPMVEAELLPPEADANLAFWDFICELILTFDS